MGGYENGDSPAAAAWEGGVILGVDGGTTSTVCVCLPAAMPPPEAPGSVAVLSRAIAGCSNRNSVGENAALETLEQVMMQALTMANTDRSAVVAVCLSVSGVNHPSDQQRMLDWICNLFPRNAKFYVENDAVAALASGTMGKLHGCVLIAGTGSIAYGVTEDGKVARAAGAGPVLGDWGRWAYADPSWARIAALVPVVVSAAEDGDKVANTILHDAVQELAESVVAVVRRLTLCGEDGKDQFPLVLVGGVLEGNKKWDISGEVIKCISKVFPGVCPIRPEVEPAIGAALLASSHLRKESKLQNGS
ncbi:unnamed protein product [Triticum turgidum subsp. durum]|uniref:N-acetyl-D-glucosamine kinase n=1 Tax=Triticum turgidum subsp. durum TaxID=4567 RepID=A0A9R1BQ96_TRITD|nr:unnamed protein product [Triticum turgidum subsp. durum]